MVNDPDRAAMWPVGIGDEPVGIDDELAERLWAESGFTSAENGPVGEPTDRLVSLSFISAAWKRRKRLWRTLAAVGLILGAALYAHKPLLYQASTTLLLIDGPNTDAVTAGATDAALAQSTDVGMAVMKTLGLPGSITTFLGSYVVTTPSPQVLVITASAPTSHEAVERASKIASTFLTVRADFARAQQRQNEISLNQQLTAAKKNLSQITLKVTQASAQPRTPARQSQLAALRQDQEAASTTLAQTQQSVTGSIVSSQAVTQVDVNESRVVNSAEPLKSSRVKNLLLYFGGGLFGGLLLGLAIVTIGAIVSNRLRRRDDIAYVIGAPVALSVGPLRKGRFPGSGGKDRKRDVERVAEQLRRTVAVGSQGPVGLAVVAIDNARTVAEPLVTLALSSAGSGSRVLLADLSPGQYAARLLGISKPGIHEVDSGGKHVTVIVPAAQDVAPLGPFRSATSAAPSEEAGEALVAAGAAADLVLTLVTLNPASGGDHLQGWAPVAVAVVTTGESTAERIRATGDMVRFAGLRLDSTILLGADVDDASLGRGNPDF